MKRRQVIFLSFMLFTLFFGAGNLIFPPLLGFESGVHFGPAITGFLVTGVLLPCVAILAIALSDNGLISIGSRVNHVFGLLFAIIIYLSIGALYGIPRAANVAYELGFKQVFVLDHWFVLFIFSLVFFGITYYLSFNPKKMIDRVGQLLSPILLFVLGILFVQALLKFENIPSEAQGDYITSPFVSGFLQGYFTMDALGALAFGIVVINGLKDHGVKTKAGLVRGSVRVAAIAGLALTIVYFFLGWIGRVIPGDRQFTNGADILTEAANLLFARGGGLLFGVIVILACLTTCVGLANASSQFFHEVYPRLSYQSYLAIFVLVGLLVTNLGLELILSLATPILVFIYPIATVLIVLSLFEQVAGGGKRMYQLAVLVTSIYALYSALTTYIKKIPLFEQTFGIVPFFEYGLGWIVPALIAAFIGYGIDHRNRTKEL